MHPRDVLIVRSGVEFWAGVAAGVLLAVLGARRDSAAPSERLADLAPYALLAYGGYEAACLVRDGCYGPNSSIGLVPRGLSTRMLPIGILAALVCVAVGLLLIRLGRRRPVTEVLLAVATVASVRAIASFWLPRIGDGPTRQHRQSILVAVAAVGVIAILALASVETGDEAAPSEGSDLP